MSSPFPGSPNLTAVKGAWGWFIALGIILVIGGFFALGSATLASEIMVFVCGWLLSVSGVAQALHACWRRAWSGFFIELISGLISFALGVLLITRPLEGAISITLMIAIMLVIGGTFRTISALTVPHETSGWLLLSGIISLLLGIEIWVQWPLSGLWVIGTFVGINMIFNGVQLVMLGMAAKKLPD